MNDSLHTRHLVDLERKTVRLMVSDGSLDLILGVGLLSIGMAWALDGPAELLVLAGATFGLPALWRFLRRTVTRPRIGHVELHSWRQNRLHRGKLLLLAFLVLIPIVCLPVVTIAPETQPTLGLLSKLMFAAAVVAAGSLLEVPRLYAYGLVMAAFTCAAWFADVPHEFSTMAAGLVISVAGLVLLGRFVAKYPRQDLDEAADD